MKKLTKASFVRGEEEYELAIGWEDEAFVDGAIAFTVTAKRRNTETDETYENIEVTVSIEGEDERKPILLITDGNNLNIEYDLTLLTEDSQIVDLIPSWFFGGDPIFGCLIRSGLSASIAQIIDCKDSTKETPWYYDRCKKIGSCLRSSISDIGINMCAKAWKCLVNFGF